MLRSEALMSFLDGHKEDIIAVHDSVGNEKGYISYKSLTESSGIYILSVSMMLCSG